MAEPATSPLLLVAEHGVSSSAIVDFSLTRDDEAHPLVRAMDRTSRPISTHPADQFRAPIEGRSVLTPFRCAPRTTRSPHGLLLASAPGRELHPEVAWLARMLGRQVSRLLSRQTLAETRFGQERMLLYSIINAVTDPILLTDTEGKLIIANTHAEKLFAAPEDASEGWRRAAA